MKKLLLISLMSFISFSVNAGLAGKNVVHIHGLGSPFDSDFDIVFTEDEGDDNPRKPYYEAFMSHDSARRIHEQSGDLYKQIMQLQESGLCADGCIFVGESTGDLIIQYLLDNLNHWDIDSSKFRISAVVSLNGASGGSEYANFTAVAGVPLALVDLVSSIVGWNVNDDFFGEIKDLVPNTSRTFGKVKTSIPQLRVVSSGGLDDLKFGNFTFLADALKFFLKYSVFLGGEHDSVLAIHSACGSSKIGSYNACYKNGIRHDGKHVNNARAPKSLRHNRYAIMTLPENGHTIGLSGPVANPMGKAVPSLRSPTDHSNGDGDTVSLSFETKTDKRTTGFWIWKKTHKYTYVRKDKNDNIYDFLANIMN